MFENANTKVNDQFSDKMSTEEAWNKTYNLLRDIFSHFEKFNGLKSVGHSSAPSGGFYAHYQVTASKDETIALDKNQQFLADQKLIETGLKKLEQEIHQNSKHVESSSKVTF